MNGSFKKYVRSSLVIFDPPPPLPPCTLMYVSRGPTSHFARTYFTYFFHPPPRPPTPPPLPPCALMYVSRGATSHFARTYFTYFFHPPPRLPTPQNTHIQSLRTFQMNQNTFFKLIGKNRATGKMYFSRNSLNLVLVIYT